MANPIFWTTSSTICAMAKQGNGRRFPKEAKESKLQIQFSSHANPSEFTLVLRQYDVKQDWHVLLNESEVGVLVTDEKDMKVYFAIPPNSLREGQNELQINCSSQTPDDIRVSELILDERPLKEVLSEAIARTTGNRRQLQQSSSFANYHCRQQGSSSNRKCFTKAEHCGKAGGRVYGRWEKHRSPYLLAHTRFTRAEDLSTVLNSLEVSLKRRGPCSENPAYKTRG